MKASVLAIGTEITDGQIINKNASWISARLKEFGLQTSVHLVVPDERSLILEALDFCAQRSEVLFVTGGLGPTTDDFTRDMISEWAGQPLEFDQASWQHLTERLTSRGYRVQEIQRQQCFFPKESEILVNPQGTANAFYIMTKNRHVFVLPGPPREIDAVWQNSIKTWLDEKTKGLDPFVTHKWDTLGLGESDIASMTETALKGIAIEKGYRVHLPYVEVKLSYFQSRASEFQSAIEKVESVLAPWTMARNGEDVAERLFLKLSSVSSLQIIDTVSGAFLLNRLLPGLRAFIQKNTLSFHTVSLEQPPDAATLRLGLHMVNEHTCAVSIWKNGQQVEDYVISPYKTANMHERMQQYFSETALLFWLKHLQ